jgi:shikimate dehydrogenase
MTSSPDITGTTRVYGIVADPIAQVRTPQGLNALMQRHGVDGIMVPFHVAPADLARFMDGMRVMRSFGGLIATVPHKVAMLSLCDIVSERARLIGAVNAVRREADGRLAADMFDGDGFVAGLREGGVEPEGKRAYMAGAGGAANAIAFALAEAGVASLTIWNRTPTKVKALRARLNTLYPDLAVAGGTANPHGYDLVVNATSLGLKPDDPLPLDPTGLEPGMVVAEVVMQPEVTALLAAALARGCRVHSGRPMLACQLTLMARFLGMIR